MERRLVVATECPTCGASLDFTEGSNAVRCPYCQSRLLVTGRKQALSYYVEPKVAPGDATRTAWNACRGKGWRCRVRDAERYFVPYYRLTGHDLRWERAEPKRKPLCGNERKLRRELAALALQSAAASAPSALRAMRPIATQQPSGRLRDRYVDRNFLACRLGSAELYSLGIRLAVLRLRLLRTDALRKLGRIVATDLEPQAAVAQGMETAAFMTNILERKVLGRLLSVVYYPFCVLDLAYGGETKLGIVDGVSGTVVTLDLPLSIREVLRREPKGDPESVAFRPLVCPNCGWDLPVEPEHVVFFCASCERAWQIHGRELRNIKYQIAAVAKASAEQSTSLRYLPFWVMKLGRRKRPARFYVPAFHYRRLKVLVDLARDISGGDRSYATRSGTGLDLQGCYYDQEDAVCMAEITYPGLTHEPERTIEQLRNDPLALSGPTLTWFPFHIEGQSLRAPFTRRAINQRLLL
ncbi:MAG: hypothetical protein ACE5I7_16255 [Candidatus Binatia bacterium]